MVDAEENEADKNEVFLQKQGVGNEGQIKPQPEATKIERRSKCFQFLISKLLTFLFMTRINLE